MISWQTKTAKLLGRLTIRQALKRNVSVDDMRKQIRAVERFFPAKPDDVRIDHEPGLEHCDAEWITPESESPERVVLHLPGGAFMTRFARAERLFVARLCKAAHARGRLVFYRLAPEHPYPAGLDDCREAYRQLLDLGVAPEKLFVSGMSAGGSLALSLLLSLRDDGLPMPAGALLMSPATDFGDGEKGGSREANEKLDALLSLQQGDEIRRLYLGDRKELIEDPYVSPVMGDFTGLPPLFFQVSNTEILLDDSQRCADRAREAGVSAEVEVWDRMPHGWQALHFTPESGRAIGRLADFIREHSP